jgi:hypothetical protein
VLALRAGRRSGSIPATTSPIPIQRYGVVVTAMAVAVAALLAALATQPVGTCGYLAALALLVYGLLPRTIGPLDAFELRSFSPV